MREETELGKARDWPRATASHCFIAIDLPLSDNEQGLQGMARQDGGKCPPICREPEHRPPVQKVGDRAGCDPHRAGGQLFSDGTNDGLAGCTAADKVHAGGAGGVHRLGCLSSCQGSHLPSLQDSLSVADDVDAIRDVRSAWTGRGGFLPAGGSIFRRERLCGDFRNIKSDGVAGRSR